MTRVVVAPELEAAVLRHCARWSPKETGGIMVGYRCDLAIHLTGFGGPGPRAKHARATFVRDGEFAQQVLDDALRESVGAIDYVGEWHSHPAPVEPSGRDASSMTWVATNDRYACDEPILVIATKERRGWVLHAFRSKNGILTRCEVDSHCDGAGRHPVDGITVTPDGN